MLEIPRQNRNTPKMKDTETLVARRCRFSQLCITVIALPAFFGEIIVARSGKKAGIKTAVKGIIDTTSFSNTVTDESAISRIAGINNISEVTSVNITPKPTGTNDIGLMLLLA